MANFAKVRRYLISESAADACHAIGELIAWIEEHEKLHESSQTKLDAIRDLVIRVYYARGLESQPCALTRDQLIEAIVEILNRK